MRALTHAVSDPTHRASHRPEWLKVCRDWRHKYDPVTLPHLMEFHTYGFMRELSRIISSDAIIVNDTGGAVISFAHAFETKRGQTYITNNGNTPMGFSMCAALGAWAAAPTRPVYCLIGDGGMNMNIQELQTIKRLGADIKIFVLNNLCYGNTAAYQDTNYAGRRIACAAPDYVPPDFIAVAKAYGIPAITIDRYWDQRKSSFQRDTFEDGIIKVLETRGPIVVDVRHDGFCNYEPRMTRWDCGIEEMQPYLDRAEFRENMIGVEPLEGWEGVK
jgi:acetolactate synthase-1/2/3 large subunit